MAAAEDLDDGDDVGLHYLGFQKLMERLDEVP